jgi:hypothetical protein
MDPSRVNWTPVFRRKDRPVGRTYKPDWPFLCAFGSAPAPKAGGLSKTNAPFSVLLLKTNNLAESLACVWLCATVRICLKGGHKNRHRR